MISLLVGTGPSQTLLTAHKALLTRSPFFSEKLASSNSQVDLADEDLDAMSCFLEYLYTGEYYPHKLPSGNLEPDPEVPKIDDSGAQLLKHAKVYTLADKLGMPVRVLHFSPSQSYLKALIHRPTIALTVTKSHRASNPSLTPKSTSSPLLPSLNSPTPATSIPTHPAVTLPSVNLLPASGVRDRMFCGTRRKGVSEICAWNSLRLAMTSLVISSTLKRENRREAVKMRWGSLRGRERGEYEMLVI